MTQVGQIYKCTVCGNTVEVKAAGVGKLACCGQPMGLVPGQQEMAGQTPAPEAAPQENQATEINEVPPMPPTPETPEEPET